MYSIYILWSEKLQKYYIGHADNLTRKLQEHNSGKSLFTKSDVPWELKSSEKFNSRSEAMRREHEIKQRKSRRFIEDIITREI